MSYTPVHDMANMDLLEMIPVACSDLIEIGCSSGALARELKIRNPDVKVFGVDVCPEYVGLASRYCDVVECLDLDVQTDDFYEAHSSRDAWVFGDTLEHLRDPWKVLRSIRGSLRPGGCIVACVPNAQHWSVIARLCSGFFRYEESGLMDRTHLRWFTRQTLIELFDSCGYTVVDLRPRIFDEPDAAPFLPIIGEVAEMVGADPVQASQDSMALQFLVRAIPKL